MTAPNNISETTKTEQIKNSLTFFTEDKPLLKTDQEKDILIELNNLCPGSGDEVSSRASMIDYFERSSLKQLTGYFADHGNDSVAVIFDAIIKTISNEFGSDSFTDEEEVTFSKSYAYNLLSNIFGLAETGKLLNSLLGYKHGIQSCREKIDQTIDKATINILPSLDGLKNAYKESERIMQEEIEYLRGLVMEQRGGNPEIDKTKTPEPKTHPEKITLDNDLNQGVKEWVCSFREKLNRYRVAKMEEFNVTDVILSEIGVPSITDECTLQESIKQLTSLYEHNALNGTYFFCQSVSLSRQVEALQKELKSTREKLNSVRSIAMGENGI